MTDKKYYFAYGSNMKEKQMKDRGVQYLRIAVKAASQDGINLATCNG